MLVKPKPSKWRWTRRAFAVLALTMIIGWIVESPIRPGASRDDPDRGVHRSGGMAYIHGPITSPRLSDDPAGAIGMIRFTRALHANDERVFDTEVMEYRRLTVVVYGSTLGPEQVRPWRPRAAIRFKDPWALADDFDGTHTLWFGYPGEIVSAMLEVALTLIVIPLLILGFMMFLCELVRMSSECWATDARTNSLRKHICPNCQYDIRGLRDCRCPECGERWRKGQVPEGLR